MQEIAFHPFESGLKGLSKCQCKTGVGDGFLEIYIKVISFPTQALYFFIKSRPASELII